MESNQILKPEYIISYSEYSAYLQCPHKWFMQYQLKMRSPGSEELIFGSALHDTIESVLTNSFVKKLCLRNPKHIHGVFQNKLKDEVTKINDMDLLKKISDNNILGIFYFQGTKILTELNIFKRFNDYEIIDVEYDLDGFDVIETDEFRIKLKGFIDMVLKHKETGRYLILDWKTSFKKWDINKKEENKDFYNQLILYKCYYAKAKNIPLKNIDIGFFNLPRFEPKEMDLYTKEINLFQTMDFEKRFSEKCKEIVSFNVFNLKKAKFITKENYCNRCHLNNEENCNDLDEYQVVKITITEEELQKLEKQREERKKQKEENEKK